MGSLIAAIASYCEARKNNGLWLLRIEDIDPPREVTGASQSIIDDLINLGFEHDRTIMFQSHGERQKAYEKSIEILNQHLYRCACSRNQLKNISTIKHQCRYHTKKIAQSHSIKLRVPDIDISFIDKIQGHYQKNLLNDCGDFIIKRKDLLISYQIAVVVDDHYQGVTDVVRGIDLIDSTPWQIYLHKLLNINLPHYAHIPIIVNEQQQKLSKQTFATAINTKQPIKTLRQAFSYLNQPISATNNQSLKQFWLQAIDQWDINKIKNVQTIHQ